MLGKLCNLLVISVFFTCCLAVDVTDFKRSFSLDCDSQYNPLCFKMDIAAFIERLSTSPELILTPSVSIVRDGNATNTKNSEIIAELSRSFPNDPSKRMDGFLFSKLSDYLQSHTLRFRLWDNKSSLEDAKAAFTGRKGKIGGKKGGLEGLLAAAMMMKGTMMALALGALAALAGKALMTGMMALMLSAIVGLKALASGGGKQTTYEIVAKPYYSHSHSSSHEDHGHGGGGGGGGHGSHTGYGGYGRSLNFVLPEHLKKP
ncbi:uncharacterized protein LOC129789579 [Lutzomyia longipalpis]|uniref:uncharacterized protein LOC129789579 n=1 Tax=Lutzomyia longipalpis TaxID=7200 RepID=UPI0024833BAD|nr:uncharacterized protein LOC129789579 [Lutzomyia longipalpis]